MYNDSSQRLSRLSQEAEMYRERILIWLEADFFFPPCTKEEDSEEVLPQQHQMSQNSHEHCHTHISKSC